MKLRQRVISGFFLIVYGGRKMNIKINKKGIAPDMLLNVGILLIGAFGFVFAISIMSGAVTEQVKGSADYSVQEMGAYMDFALASSEEMIIHIPTPTDFAGYPTIGSILINPTEGEIRISRYPLDYAADMIINAGFKSITLEEAVLSIAIIKHRKELAARRLAAQIYADPSTGLAFDETKWERFVDDEYAKMKPSKGESEVNRDNANKRQKKNAQKKATTRYQKEALSKSREFSSRPEIRRVFKGVDTPGSRLLTQRTKLDGPFGRNFVNSALKNPDGMKSLLAEGPSLSSMYDPETGNPKLMRKYIDLHTKVSASDFDPALNDKSKNLHSKYMKTHQEVVETFGRAPSTTTTNFLSENPAFAKQMGKSGAIGAELRIGVRAGSTGSLGTATAVISNPNHVARKSLIQLNNAGKIGWVKNLKRFTPLYPFRWMWGKTGTPIANQISKRILNPVMEQIKTTTVSSKLIIEVGTITDAIKEQKTTLRKYAQKHILKRPSASSLRSIGAVSIAIALKPVPYVGWILNRAVGAISMALEWVWTLVPINHWIDRSQEASNKVDNSFSTYTYAGRGKTVQVDNYNCDYDAEVRYVTTFEDLAANKADDNIAMAALKFVGEVTQVVKLLDTAGQTPGSKTDFDKNINTAKITAINSEECIGAIDWRISDKVDTKIENYQNFFLGDLDFEDVSAWNVRDLEDWESAIRAGAGAIVGSYLKENPKQVVATIPFAICTVQVLRAGERGPGCFLFWNIAYASSWMDSELSVGESAALIFTAYYAPWIGGIAPATAIALLTLEADTIVNWGDEYTWEAGDKVLSEFGMDSSTFAPYLSKSHGLVDSRTEFLIEDPFLISISKTYTEDGEEVLGVYSE